MRWGLALVAVSGCGRLGDVLKEPTNDDAEEVYSTPTGDGSHYIAVFSEPQTPSGSMARRWKKHATKVCEGDYLVMSENAAERRRGGFVESKVTKDGCVVCLRMSRSTRRKATASLRRPSRRPRTTARRKRRHSPSDGRRYDNDSPTGRRVVPPGRLAWASELSYARRYRRVADRRRRVAYRQGHA